MLTGCNSDSQSKKEIESDVSEEAVVGKLIFNLPKGYRHQVGKGIDTVVGSFYTVDPYFEIRYDIGPGAGVDRVAKFAQKSKDSIVHDKIIHTGLGGGRLVSVMIEGEPKFGAIFEAAPGVILYAIGLTEQQLADFMSIAESIRLSPESNTKK